MKFKNAKMTEVAQKNPFPNRGTASPAESSKSISEQNLLGEYISGRSYQGSDGKT